MSNASRTLNLQSSYLGIDFGFFREQAEPAFFSDFQGLISRTGKNYDIAVEPPSSMYCHIIVIDETDNIFDRIIVPRCRRDHTHPFRKKIFH